MRRLLVLLPLVTACGYGGAKGGDTSAFAGGSTGTGASGGVVDSNDTESGIERATWFSLGGTLDLGDGGDRADGAELSVHFFPEDVTSLDLALCSSSVVEPELVVAPSPDPDVEMAVWWEFPAPSLPDCPSAAWPEGLAMGIGPYDPLLDPAAARLGLDTSALNGLYAQVGVGGPLYIFGLVGTASQFDASGEAVVAPLPDGLYELLTLHLLPIDAR